MWILFLIDKSSLFVARNIGKPSLCVKHTMPADGVVEDLLWNSEAEGPFPISSG